MSHQRPRRTSNRSSSSRTSGPPSQRLISTHDGMLTDQVPREEAKETHRWFFPPLEKKKRNRIEGKGRTWQIALWTHWRSWIVSPGARGTSNRPSNDWWNQIARKRYWPWQKFAFLDDRVVTWLVPLGPWEKKYRLSYEILDPWNLSGFVGRVDSFCETGIDSFPRG